MNRDPHSGLLYKWLVEPSITSRYLKGYLIVFFQVYIEQVSWKIMKFNNNGSIGGNFMRSVKVTDLSFKWRSLDLKCLSDSQVHFFSLFSDVFFQHGC